MSDHERVGGDCADCGVKWPCPTERRRTGDTTREPFTHILAEHFNGRHS